MRSSLSRFQLVPALALACAALSGCTSSMGLDGIMPQPKPSAETTSSVVKPVPPARVREAAASRRPRHAPRDEILAWTGPVPDGGPFKAELGPDAADDTTEQPAPPPVPVGPIGGLASAPTPGLRPVTPPPTNVAMPMPIPGATARPPVRLSPQEWQKVYSRRFRDAKPINFGRSSPRMLAVHGVDVSRWQGDIDWPKLRTQGANFAYIKATDGGDHLDPMFRKNWREAGEAGIRRGAYHFFYWCRAASQQADWFIRNVPKDPNALPPVIDVEWNGDSSCRRRPSPAQVREKMQAFMDRLERHYGKRPIIYTAPDFYDDNLRGAFPNYHFWLRAVARHPSKVYPGRRWVFWQYSGSGLSKGVNHRIDLNVFHGSPDEWYNFVERTSG